MNLFQSVISDLDSLAPRLDSLHESAIAITTTVPPMQREIVLTTVAEVRAHWKQLYGEADQKMEVLAELAELMECFERDVAVVSTWLEHSQPIVQSKLEWTNLHTVQSQLTEHRVSSVLII